MMMGGLLLASLLLGSLQVNGARAGAPDLFGDGGNYDVAAHPLAPQMMRARYVTVNTAMLFAVNGRPLGKGILPEVSLNLFADASYTGRVERVWQDSWGAYWTGSLNGVPGGYFYLTVVDGAFMAHVGSPRGIYEVAYTTEGQYRVVQIDQSKFVDHDPNWTFDAPGAIMSDAEADAAADSGSTIDIMVAYTDDARAAAGGTPAIKATILTALNETNTGYSQSGVTTRLRLVHVEEYAYTESGDLFTDLDRFTNTTDNNFKTIHALRNTYGADMVGLIVENGGAYCGLANAIMATASNAFQVTARSCATGYYSFGHEFGHLQGARHDRYVDSSNTPYSYGHGYVNLNARWRTIMAYNNECADTSPYSSCTRIQYWSNPGKSYGGAPTGKSNTKNYLVLNNTDVTVANFRTAVIGDGFNSQFNTDKAGWSNVVGTWTLYNSVNLRTTGTASKLASTVHAGEYGDMTYEASMKRMGCNSCWSGLILRGNSASRNADGYWKSSYWFAYNRNGRFLVYKYNATGGEVVLKGSTANAAINTGSDWNTLKVVAVGSSLKFYINGTLVWSGTDAAYAVGDVGIGMQRDAASSGNVLYVNWAKLSTTPTADE